MTASAGVPGCLSVTPLSRLFFWQSLCGHELSGLLAFLLLTLNGNNTEPVHLAKIIRVYPAFGALACLAVKGTGLPGSARVSWIGWAVGGLDQYPTRTSWVWRLIATLLWWGNSFPVCWGCCSYYCGHWENSGSGGLYTQCINVTRGSSCCMTYIS